jgi:hypothetical protein
MFMYSVECLFRERVDGDEVRSNSGEGRNRE